MLTKLWAPLFWGGATDFVFLLSFRPQLYNKESVPSWGEVSRKILWNCDLAVRKEVLRLTWSILKTPDLEQTFYYPQILTLVLSFVTCQHYCFSGCGCQLARTSAALPFPFAKNFISQAFIKWILYVTLFLGNQIYLFRIKKVTQKK